VGNTSVSHADWCLAATMTGPFGTSPTTRWRMPTVTASKRTTPWAQTLEIRNRVERGSAKAGIARTPMSAVQIVKPA
jgi:hypothetical protein